MFGLNRRYGLERANLAAAALGAVLLLSAWEGGLFFEEASYRLAVVLAAGAALACLAVLACQPIGRRSSGIPSKASVLASTCVMPLALAGAYALHLLSRPLSDELTAEQAVRWGSYFLFAVLLRASIGWTGGRRHLASALMAATLGTTIAALAGWLGWRGVAHAVLWTDDPQISAAGARLGGPFQYPNMLGAVAGALLLWHAAMLAKARRTRTYGLAFALVSLSAATLLLTESRGAWLTTLCGAAAAWLAMPRTQRTVWLLRLSAAALAASAAVQVLEEPGRLRLDTAAAAACLAALAGAWLAWPGKLELASRRIGLPGAGARGGFAALALGLGTCMLGAAWLAQRPRLLGRSGAGGYETASSRLHYYRDAWRLIRESWWFGEGGGAWALQYEGVRTLPYVSTEVHSGYLNLALELGMTGLAAVLLWLAAVLAALWRKDRQVIPAVVVLLSHAAFDFDMSYGYYWLLLLTLTIYGLTGGEAGMAGEQVGRSAIGGLSIRQGERRNML
ncbi:O-antigen ligase family protein [Paenibacillus sp. IB182496]|uniref:O-antigen ligase family protein n=1 Tax=Paenibacillus sabuli TaxID=2772509 RepID=A0A927BT18_9BACL|nr:O-antigen ligase family protein [Paenibacillus sabuli]MBD2844898.1 O-antigen ligase family protein [Paenibacillus sabuli]